MFERGIIYIATGKKYVQEAKLSARSVKQHNDIHITLISDIKTSDTEFDTIKTINNPEYDFGDIVEYIDKSPYDKTLYLDTDTYICDNLEEIFLMLNEFDVALSVDKTGWHMDEYSLEHPIKNVPEGFPWYNGGVIAFRDNDRVTELQSLWQSEYQNDLDNDMNHNMMSLRHSLYHSNVRILTLPTEYNCLFREADHILEQIKIFHGRIIDIDGVGADKRFNIKEAKCALNSKSGSRVYIPHVGGRFRIVDSEPIYTYVLYPNNIFTRVLGSIIRQGLVDTIRSGLQLLKNSNARDN